MPDIDRAILTAATEIVWTLMPMGGKTPEQIDEEILRVYDELMEGPDHPTTSSVEDAAPVSTELLQEPSMCRFLKRWIEDGKARAAEADLMAEVS